MGCALRNSMVYTIFKIRNTSSIILLHLLQQNNRKNMALVSKKDFGIALNVAYGTVRSKISRNQLCCNKKGLIDTEQPLNYVYLLEVNGGDQSVFDDYNLKSSNTKVNKKTSSATKNTINVSNMKQKEIVVEVAEKENASENKGSVKVSPSVKPKEVKAKIVVEAPIKETAEERRIAKEQRESNRILLQYEIRKKEAELSLVERNAELKKMELEKKAGNTLPLDLVRKIEVINFQTILNTFLTESRNMATIMVERFGGSRSDVVEIEKKLNIQFKKTVETIKKNVDREIENAVSEYSEVRSRGERK
jgi:hypothetical protein